ncbi:MAG: hypothetical protein MJ177_10395 [Clostridia bacterium]|nr:hypothetical protein [Clostridia bacterium]
MDALLKAIREKISAGDIMSWFWTLASMILGTFVKIFNQEAGIEEDNGDDGEIGA